MRRHNAHLLGVKSGLDAVCEVVVPHDGVELPPQPPVPAQALVGPHLVGLGGKSLVVAQDGEHLLHAQH